MTGQNNCVNSEDPSLQSENDGTPLETVPRVPRKSVVKVWVALMMGLAATTIFALLSDTTRGESALSDAAISGETEAVGIVALAYGMGVILSLGSLLVAFEPFFRGHRRPWALIAALVGLSSPLIGAGIAWCVSAALAL